MAMMRPYSPMASAKIITRIIPMNILSVWAYACKSFSPAMPIAKPDASDEKPQTRPAPRN